MRTDFPDRTTDRDSMIARLDPRAKLIAAVAYVVIVVTTPPGEIMRYGFFAALILTVVGLGRVSMRYLVSRLLTVIPFALMAAVFLPFRPLEANAPAWTVAGMTLDPSGVTLFWSVTLKALLAATAMITLTASTPFERLLGGMKSLRVPGVLLMMIAFMYRYLFVLTDQAQRMDRARESRSARTGKASMWRTRVSMIGGLFLRAYERAERVYRCMVSRGYDGEIRASGELALSRADVVLGLLFVACVLTVRLVRFR